MVKFSILVTYLCATSCDGIRIWKVSISGKGLKFERLVEIGSSHRRHLFSRDIYISELNDTFLAVISITSN